MVTSAAPYAIGLGVSAFTMLLLFSFANGLGAWLKRLGEGFRTSIESADIAIAAEEYALIVLAAGAIVWIGVVATTRVALLQGIVYLPLCFALAVVGGVFFLRFKARRRLAAFTQQLEMILRTMAGALRVGLGLRQAIILVSEEAVDPARREFARIVGRTNIGIGIHDSIDELARTMPSQEMTMLARAIRVQSQTGGDLAQVLETLATTIKDRRRIHRKMQALTAQGKITGYVIGALPLFVGGFVVITQPDMSSALLHTKPGWIALGIVAFLEVCAVLSIKRILRFDQ